MKKFVILGLVSVAAASQAILVDDFTTGATSFSITGSSIVGVGAGSMLSGERDVEASVLANPFSQFIDVNIGGGLSIVSNGFGSDSIIKLQYDVIGDETVGLGNTLNNNGSGSSLGLNGDRVRVYFLGNDLDVNIVGSLRLSGGQLQNVSNNKFAGGAGFVDLVFNSSLLAQADSLTLEFHAQPSGDFVIQRIESVPEPATLAILGLGAAAAIRRRRSK